MNQKITQNFSFYEFRPKGMSVDWGPTNEYQKMLIINLAKNIQIVRDKMPAGSSIGITSGVRSPEDYNRLLKAGYNPSTTSDHNFGNSVSIENGTNKYKKYGPTYIFSVGAADCIPSGMSVIDFFNLAKNLTKNNKCRFGQVIYENNPSDKKEWVHLGGDHSLIFSNDIVAFLNKEKFLKSLDGGKTYQQF